MLLLASNNGGNQKYVLFEQPKEVQYLSLEGLGYFKRTLGMGDYLEGFQSWISNQRSLLFGCVEGNALVGWCMFEQWEKGDRDGTPIYVLRTIEVRTMDRRKKIGLNLVALLALVAPGHIVTRPLSANAKAFFEGVGFISPPEDAHIDFHDKYGYLLLPSVVKRSLFSNPTDKELILEQGNIDRCSGSLRTHVLRDEISRVSGFAQAFKATLAMPNKEPEAEKIFIKTDTSKIACACGSKIITFYTIPNGKQEHISVECDRCGEVWLTVPI